MDQYEIYELFFTACAEGNMQIIKKYISHNLDPKIYNCYCLDVACKYGKLPVVTYLLSHGVPISAAEDSIVLAAKYNHINICRFLVSKGINIKNNIRAIQAATIAGNLEIVTYLLSTGINPNFKNNLLIKAAIEANHLNLVQYFIRINPSINNILPSVIEVAVQNNKLEIIIFLNKYCNATIKKNIYPLLYNLAMSRHFNDVGDFLKAQINL